MQFNVKDQEYFLSFSEDDKRFYLIAPTPSGMQHIPVYMDDGKWERIGEREPRTPRVQ
jgi:hypothetical protein